MSWENGSEYPILFPTKLKQIRSIPGLIESPLLRNELSSRYKELNRLAEVVIPGEPRALYAGWTFNTLQ